MDQKFLGLELIYHILEHVQALNMWLKDHYPIIASSHGCVSVQQALVTCTISDGIKSSRSGPNFSSLDLWHPSCYRCHLPWWWSPSSTIHLLWSFTTLRKPTCGSNIFSTDLLYFPNWVKWLLHELDLPVLSIMILMVVLCISGLLIFADVSDLVRISCSKFWVYPLKLLDLNHSNSA